MFVCFGFKFVILLFNSFCQRHFRAFPDLIAASSHEKRMQRYSNFSNLPNFSASFRNAAERFGIFYPFSFLI